VIPIWARSDETIHIVLVKMRIILENSVVCPSVSQISKRNSTAILVPLITGLPTSTFGSTLFVLPRHNGLFDSITDYTGA